MDKGIKKGTYWPRFFCQSWATVNHARHSDFWVTCTEQQMTSSLHYYFLCRCIVQRAVKRVCVCCPITYHRWLLTWRLLHKVARSKNHYSQWRLPTGDRGVATGIGAGYCWEYLVTSRHIGGLGVMVVHCRIAATTMSVSYLGDKAALFRDSAAFSTRKGGYTRHPKQR